MTLPGAVGFQAALSQARNLIDEAQMIVIAGTNPSVIPSAQYKVIDAIAALMKAGIVIENVEDALDAN